MSERRRADLILPLLKGKTNQVKVELFRSTLWDHPEVASDLFRLRVDEKWLHRDGEAMSFFDLATTMAIVGDLAAKHLGVGPLKPQPACPDIPAGTWVRQLTAEGDIRARTATIPFQNRLGEWCVWLIGQRGSPALLANLTLEADSLCPCQHARLFAEPLSESDV